MHNKKFLTAEWRKLIMANYAVDPSLLQGFLPRYTELDSFNGNYYVSLVGFLFKNVRVKGIKIPFHVNFPEVNLRFYVRYKENAEWKRGVVFISEIVPKPAIVFVANTLYKEHYASMPMRYTWEKEKDDLLVSYAWKKNKRWNHLGVRTGATALALQKDSEEEFITEHFWGYSAFSEQQTNEYHVEHPRWMIYPIKEYRIDCDFGALYGEKFSFLAQKKPDSVFMAEGSEIAVFQKKVLGGRKTELQFR